MNVFVFGLCAEFHMTSEHSWSMRVPVNLEVKDLFFGLELASDCPYSESHGTDAYTYCRFTDIAKLGRGFLRSFVQRTHAIDLNIIFHAYHARKVELMLHRQRVHIASALQLRQGKRKRT